MNQKISCITVCPGSSDPFYIVGYYIKWVTTSWTHSIYIELEKEKERDRKRERKRDKELQRYKDTETQKDDTVTETQKATERKGEKRS